MRIGVDFSFLAHGPGVTRRGVGRFVTQQVGALLDHAANETLVALCPAEVDTAVIDAEAGLRGRLEIHRLARARTREDALRNAVSELRLDVVHQTTPLFDPFVSELGVAVVATVYDAIPLAYPLAYLAAEGDATPIFLNSARLLRRADHVLTISAATRLAACAYFGIDPALTSVAFPFADARFAPLSATVRAERLTRLGEAVGLPDQFVLSVPHLHHSKNIAGLLDAFALLPERLATATPLVIACALEERAARILSHMIASRSLQGRVLVTGYVSDDELVALYGAAQICLHVSHLEGFGLPALEAMRCGTPVLVSRDTATREIVGELELTVDGEDPAAIAARLRALLETSPETRSALAQQCRERADAFGPGQLAQATVAAYDQARAHFDRRAEPPRPRQIRAASQIMGEWLRGSRSDTALRVRAPAVDPTPPAADEQTVGALAAATDCAIVTGLIHPLVDRGEFVTALRAARRTIRTGGRLIGSVLLVECQPPDVSLIDLDLPVFTEDEWRTWLGTGLELERIDELDPLRAALGPLPDALDPATLARGVANALLPDQRTLYLDGVAVGLYAFTCATSGDDSPWPVHFEARQSQRAVRARSLWMERLQAEQAYLLDVTVKDLTPAWARRLPAQLRKPLRHLRRLGRLGRAQEAQAVLYQHLIEGVARGRRRAHIDVADDLVAAPIAPDAAFTDPWI